MSANPEILVLSQTPGPAQVPSPVPSSDPPVAPASGHRRTGKIARLPKALRDRLDELMEDGHSYDSIRQALGEPARDITDNNFSNWKKGGHQDWLRNKFWCDEMRLRQEDFTNLLAGADPLKLPEAGLQLAATGACELLRDIIELKTGPNSPADPDKLVRVANSLARLSRSILTIQQYRDASAKTAAAPPQRKDLNREFNDAEYDLVTQRMDDFFRKPRRRRSGILPVSDQTVSEKQPAPHPPAPAPTPANEPPASSNIENRHSEIVNDPPAQNPTAPSTSATPIDAPKIADPESETQSDHAHPSDQPRPSAPLASAAPAPQPEVSSASPANPITQQSIDPPLPAAPPERCYDCGVLLPPLLPGGQRPYPACRACRARLYPPGTPFDRCLFCGAANPILNGNRPSTECRRCRCALPPPGQRFLTACPKCGLKLNNVTNLGTRIADRCPGCRAPLPLLEPAPADSPPLP